jgi:6-pyruvoyltetrahydropterin/6-carboxytetrahydropterin synthase
MYKITVLSHFSGAHHLRCLHGKCEKLHGHNWKIEVSIVSDRLNPEGVVIDFQILKQKVQKVLKNLDHTFLNDLPSFSKKEPSSENIARYIFGQLRSELKGYRATLQEVKAWESETACATYFRRGA